MALIRVGGVKRSGGGGCKWCAKGQCWTHGGGKGARTVVVKTFVKKGGGKGGGKRGGKGGGCKWCVLGQCWTHGGKKGGGKRGGGQGGQWLFVPKGSGKGKDKKTNKTMDKLQKIDADHKVWVGGLPKDTTWKKLEKHFEETCGTKPKISEVMPKGRGCCAFATAEDAQSAISAMNGSELDGKSIEVDVWTEKEKKEGSKKPKRKFGAAFLKKEKGPDLNSVDASLKVWVGGLSPSTNAAKLKKHFADNGCEADEAKIMKPGTGCVTFTTEAAATSAIGAINGSDLAGKTVEVDVWTKIDKAERKEKKGKKQ